MRFLSEYPDVLSVADVQAVLRIGRNKAYELLQGQHIRSIRVGKRYLVPKTALLQYLGYPPYTANRHPTMETANPGMSLRESEVNQ